MDNISQDIRNFLRNIDGTMTLSPKEERLRYIYGRPAPVYVDASNGYSHLSDLEYAEIVDAMYGLAGLKACGYRLH